MKTFLVVSICISSVLFSQTLPDSIVTKSWTSLLQKNPAATDFTDVERIPASTRLLLIDMKDEGYTLWFRVEYQGKVGWLSGRSVSENSLVDILLSSYSQTKRICPFPFVDPLQPSQTEFIGPVRSIQILELEYTRSFGEWITATHKKPDSSLFSRTGRLLYEKTTGSICGQSRVLEYIYEYNKDDQIISASITSPARITWKFGHNKEQNIDTLTTIVRDRQILGYELRFSNETGDIFRVDEVTGGELCGRLTKETNSENLERASYFDQTGELKFAWTTLRDRLGRPTEEVHYRPDGSVSTRSTYKYLPEKTIIEGIYYEEDGSQSSKVISIKDINQLLIRTIGEFDGAFLQEALGGGFSFAYEFDDHGNWTKQIKRKQSVKFGEEIYEPVEATLRRITYYPD